MEGTSKSVNAVIRCLTLTLNGLKGWFVVLELTSGLRVVGEYASVIEKSVLLESHNI